MTRSEELLDRILQLSDRMLELAMGDDWDAVVPLEKERRDLIVDCFAQDNPVHHGEGAARRLQRIIDSDRRLIAMGASRRVELGAALQKLQRGRNATDAYRHCGR